MSILHRLVPTILAFCGIAFASVAAAANAGSPTVAGPALVTLNFPGGPLDHFVEALEKAYGHPVNLIMPETANVSVPAIRVTGVSLRQVFTAIGNTNSGILFQEVASERPDGAGNQTEVPVWAVILPQAARTDPQFARSYSVEELLTKYNINDLTTAIKTAWEMARAGDAGADSGRERGPDPDLKFHQETKLLIIRGNGRHVDLAQNVLGELSQALNRGRAPTRSPEEIAALQANALELDANRLSLEAELQELQKSSPDHPQINAVKARLRAVEARIKNITAAANAQPN